MHHLNIDLLIQHVFLRTWITILLQSLYCIYIGTRSSEPIDFSDMLEGCNNLQNEEFSSSKSIAELNCLSAGILEILTFIGYDNCDKITEMKQRKCVAIA